MPVSRVSLIIPALNEAESIGFAVSELPGDQLAECIVVDNGSTDATAAVAEAAGARVIRSPRGYGAACKAGSDAALASSDILLYMDGDGADVPSFIPDIIDPILAGEADFVIGSRLRGRREPGSMLPSQVLAGRLVGSLIYATQGVRYTDMCAFRAIRREALNAMRMQEMTYGWNIEMQLKAARNKLRILEVPVDYRARFGGVSKVSGDLSASFKTARRVFEVLGRLTFSKEPGHGKS